MEAHTKMKILVTGGAGFIGSHLVRAFLDNGYEVAVVDNLSTGTRDRLDTRAQFYETDIRSKELVDVFRAEQPQFVCHQAACANVRESMEKPLHYADVNVVGSLNVLECCRQFGIKKILYASTGGAVYGEPIALPVPEEHPVNPLDPYGASKHHVEHYLYLYEKNFGLDYAALRYPNVYGPGQDTQGEAGVVAIFAGQMLGNQDPIINGSGEQERDFVFVSDVVRANLLSLTRATGIFNIGSGKGTSVNRVFQCLAEVTGFKRPPQYGPAKPGEVFRIYLDSTRAEETLGWKARISLQEGLSKTVQYIRGEVASP